MYAIWEDESTPKMVNEAMSASGIWQPNGRLFLLCCRSWLRSGLEGSQEVVATPGGHSYEYRFLYFLIRIALTERLPLGLVLRETDCLHDGQFRSAERTMGQTEKVVGDEREVARTGT